jgi:hypothetical protein
VCYTVLFILFHLFKPIHKQSDVVLPPAAGGGGGGGGGGAQSFIPELPGRDDCPPTKPVNFTDCDNDNVRCSYYDNVDDPQSEGITNCDCTKDEGVRCRPATAFVFSF